MYCPVFENSGASLSGKRIRFLQVCIYFWLLLFIFHNSHLLFGQNSAARLLLLKTQLKDWVSKRISVSEVNINKISNFKINLGSNTKFSLRCSIFQPQKIYFKAYSIEFHRLLTNIENIILLKNLLRCLNFCKPPLLWFRSAELSTFVWKFSIIYLKT
jgi:hypothetical protein